MNVQKNFFTWLELIATNTGLSNNPSSPVHLDNISYLWRYLNYLRAKLGHPIFVNSAFRTSAVNQSVNGSKTSFHLQGRAADIRTLPKYMPLLKSLLEEQKGKTIIEFIDYETFYHIAIWKANLIPNGTKKLKRTEYYSVKRILNPYGFDEYFITNRKLINYIIDAELNKTKNFANSN